MLKKKFNSMTLDEIFKHINEIESIARDLVLLNRQGSARPTEYRVQKFKTLMDKMAKAISW